MTVVKVVVTGFLLFGYTVWRSVWVCQGQLHVQSKPEVETNAGAHEVEQGPGAPDLSSEENLVVDRHAGLESALLQHVDNGLHGQVLKAGCLACERWVGFVWIANLGVCAGG